MELSIVLPVLLTAFCGFVTVQSEFTDNSNGCPSSTWTLKNGNCFYPAMDFANSWNDAVRLCTNMRATLASVMVGDSLVFDLALAGAIHPDSRFWIQQSLAASRPSMDQDDISRENNCSFVGFTSSGDTEFGTAPCDSGNIGYLCAIEPDVDASTDGESAFQAADPVPVAVSSGTNTGNANLTPGMQDDSPPVTNMVGAALIQPALPVAIMTNGTCPMPWFMSPTNESCYFIAPVFTSGNFFETSAFCQSLDGWIVEPSDVSEYKALLNIVLSRRDWTQGPWIGLIRPFNDSQLVLLSSLTAPPDADYRMRMAMDFQPQNSVVGEQNCGGFNSTGALALWDCAALGNPFCEKDLLFMDSSSDTSTISPTAMGH